MPQSQNDYLRQWLPMFGDYMKLFMKREAPPSPRSCTVCGNDGVYRCHSCFGDPLFCTDCCRTQHHRHPFHRISQWNGEFFQDTSLTDVGLEIHLGHEGNSCPNAIQSASSVFDEDDGWEELSEDHPKVVPDHHPAGTIPAWSSPQKPKTTVVVDKSGVHSLVIKECRCPGALHYHLQLFQMGLFPSSFARPRTAFTFAVLDDFLLDNLECGTSAMNYYSKLRRLTSSVFPMSVPVSSFHVSLRMSCSCPACTGSLQGAVKNCQTNEVHETVQVAWVCTRFSQTRYRRTGALLPSMSTTRHQLDHPSYWSAGWCSCMGLF